MNKILLILSALIALCISCNNKGSVSESKDKFQDSLVDTINNNPFNFLEKIGINYERLIVKKDTLPAPSVKDLILTKKEQSSLLKGIIAPIIENCDTLSVYLVAVRQINDDIVLCQYSSYSDLKNVYIVTYNSDGVIIDAMFAGSTWNNADMVYNFSNSNELITNECTYLHFIGEHEFIICSNYEELETNAVSRNDSITYSETVSMTYNIEDDGKFKMTMIDKIEEGNFRHDKKEWDLTNEILILKLYPYSDEKILNFWNELGNRVDASTSESFDYHFFNYVFLPQSEKVLKWIYNNHDNKLLTLTRPLEFYYALLPQSRKIIDDAIDKLDNQTMQAYYKEMTELWKSEVND